MKFLFLFGSLIAGLLFGSASAEQNKASAHQLSEWKFGKTLSGVTVSPAALKGKVVVLEYWGVQCQSCVKSLAQLAALDKEYRDKGLQIIAGEAYRSGQDEISDVVKSQKVKFTITDGPSGPISISSLPHAVIFGADGKVIFSGHPNDESFEKTIRGALDDVREVKKMKKGKAKTPLIAEREWKNSRGKPLVASVSRVEGEKVIFKLKDDREVAYELKNLSPEDQKLIKKMTNRG